MYVNPIIQISNKNEKLLIRVFFNKSILSIGLLMFSIKLDTYSSTSFLSASFNKTIKREPHTTPLNIIIIIYNTVFLSNFISFNSLSI